MNSLEIELENCYGIKELRHDFNFLDCNTYIIYAPNGVMKSSFAKTAKILSQDEKPYDQISPDLSSKSNFIVDGIDQINGNQFCVIEPYNEKAFESEDKILMLLANEEQKSRYLEIYKEIDALKTSSLAGLKKISGSSNFESEIIETFSYLKKKNIFEIFDEIFSEIENSKDSFLFSYNDIFDSQGKVKAFLEKNSKLLNQYADQYDQLIKDSDFFSSNGDLVFGTSEAKNLDKSLDGGAYFSVGHRLSLSSDIEIENRNDLTMMIDNEISKIFKDPDLEKIFKKVDKALNGNAPLRAFKNILDKDKEILIPLIDDYEGFKRTVWYSFLKQVESGISSLVSLYNDKKGELEDIIKEANKMTTPWQDAIDEFELRFIDIPFNMEVINKPDAILHSQTPTLQFSFKGKTVDRDFLVKDVLSQGEKRAFYLLHIIFEIKIRQTISEDTLFIIDDIADSFDYKNKYAIVEYLNDLRKEENFYCIILTHNFDFHRTISSRLGICRENRLHANKERDDIKLIQEVYQKPPFETWKNCMKACTYYDQSYTDFHALKHIIALIPFVRNLIQYGDDKEENDFSGIDKDYILLTQLLHVKDNTKDIKFTHLKKIYKQYLGKDDFDSSISDSDSIYDAIISTANRISSNDFHLENKIILAIAIRLEAEKYMFSQVTDKNYISGHQTRKLFNRYKDEFKLNTDKIRILEKVNIITPENIHLNSFMYEPILDMSINQLKNLYSEVNGL